MCQVGYLLMCKSFHVQVKVMWLIKVEMEWHLHEVPYGRRNTLGGIVFEFESKKFHFFKVSSDTSIRCVLGYYQRMEVKEVQPSIVHAQ